MRTLLLVLFSLYTCMTAARTDTAQKHIVYFIPGQGADERLFSELKLDACEMHILKFLVPEKNELLPAYAKRMSEQIDTTKPFSLAGVSMGGMVAIEISKFMNPEKVVIISSAKGRDELPMRYKLMSYVPLYKLFPGTLLKRMANIARPIVEPESKEKTPVFKAMIDAKDPLFMERSIHMIVNWENDEQPANLVHIHGTKDKTLPSRNIRNAIKVDGGGHMVTLIRAEEISCILNETFAKR
jgi:pimeloyl-ACP methyl ester carboxylesterase